MFKIKLLTLLFLSFLISSCAPNIQQSQIQYSVGYIEGELDGLNISNILIQNMKLINLYDKNSPYKIETQFTHEQSLYIINIDKTSDREKITTNIYFKIIDEQKNCILYDNKFQISQFYIFADSNKFLSNKAALDKIKYQNSEYIVKKLLSQLANNKLDCDLNE
ncbi:MAG: hypothetical protein ISQ32_06110 [Rickettsiales bacterium]|nr:hypothetical protein [Rickettsiales bacterium]